MRQGLGLVCGVFLAACGPPSTECSIYDQVYAYVDADGDGFGSHEAIGYVCDVGEGMAINNVDCNDEDPLVRPKAPELCDLVDNDCNGLVDEGHAQVPWYEDADGDGFGDTDRAVMACAAFDGAMVAVAGDCDDDNPAIHPGAPEVCNEGVDDDCDGRMDDFDPGLVTSSRRDFFFDADDDGFGNPLVVTRRCEIPANHVTNEGDCDDWRAEVYPGAPEICDRLDNDCDGLTDDYDMKDVDVTTMNTWRCDADGDGYGVAGSDCLACFPTAGFGVANALDCDDNDPLANVLQDWLLDQDADGVGADTVLHTQCLNPKDGSVPASRGVDCAPLDGQVFPGNHETCGDGLDQDCNDLDCASCGEHLLDDPTAASGVYDIDVGSDATVALYCDMTTDGGGWTLVSASEGTPVDDRAVSTTSTLTSLFPTDEHGGVYAGLRDFYGDGADLRFACKSDVANAAMTVDLTMFDVDWYTEITRSTSDGGTCFAAVGGTVGDEDPAPARRNNKIGRRLFRGDDWNVAGGLEGEDTCGDTGDFAIDFDDGGVAGTVDKTDWGEVNGEARCGTHLDPTDGAWFVFVR